MDEQASLLLDDTAWAAIEPLLQRGRRGAHRVDDRRVISGIMHMLRTGAHWRDCPPLTKPYHPWTNGEADRISRTIRSATVKTYHCDNPESLHAHAMAFVTAYNFAKHLKALRWPIP